MFKSSLSIMFTMLIVSMALTVTSGWGVSSGRGSADGGGTGTRRAFMEKAMTLAGCTSLATIAVTTPYDIANSAETEINFAGKYFDPQHENCKREIVQDMKTGSARVTGTDGSPSCPPNGSGPEWSIVGKVDGESISVDFSSKGGPKDLKGIWDTEAPAGIRWPDGNKWELLDQQLYDEGPFL